MLKSLFSRTFTAMGLILVQISFIQIETQLHISFFLFLTILKIILYIVPIHDLFGLDNMDVLTTWVVICLLGPFSLHYVMHVNMLL